MGPERVRELLDMVSFTWMWAVVAILAMLLEGAPMVQILARLVQDTAP